jgi:hypothetical protein
MEQEIIFLRVKKVKISPQSPKSEFEVYFMGSEMQPEVMKVQKREIQKFKKM